MALDFPNTPSVGQLYPSPAVAGVPVYRWSGVTWDAQNLTGTDAPSDGKTYGRLNAAWSQALPIAGGTLTGNLTISSGGQLIISSAVGQITLNKASGSAGTNCSIGGFTTGNARWVMEFGNAASESGSNVGSDFDIIRYNDAGVAIDTPFKITRSTGVITTSIDLKCGGALTALGNSIVVQAQAGANANLFFNDETGANKSTMYWERSSGTFHVTNATKDWQFQSGGQFLSALGYVCKQGFSGGYGGNSFNLFYNSGPCQLWIDATNLGNISVTSDYRTKKTWPICGACGRPLRNCGRSHTRRRTSRRHRNWSTTPRLVMRGKRLEQLRCSRVMISSVGVS
ncbi:hypothetical protein [Bradyrhizobium sp. CCGUVB1N3]|uniref:hypothetical protein n=1 Tax=Bradyrhizobium sp. CCGUVB1N3 TaxID=2949629 RepID=UPI00353182A3